VTRSVARHAHERRDQEEVAPVRRRYVGWAAAVIGAVLAVAGCSGGSDKPSVSTTGSAPSATVTRTSAATTTTKATTPPTQATKPKPTPTIAIPKVEKGAQDAVNAYVAYLRAAYLVEADPAGIRRGDMTKLLGAKALKSINASLDALGRAGIGYRGTPPDPRLKVVEVKSSKLVFLTSCPLQSKTDPYHQVVLATGKPVKVSDHKPGPPYLRTLTMFHNKKRWVLIKFSDDTSRTCTG
jgi:hypothetical protein